MRRWRPVSVGQLGSRYGRLGRQRGGSELGHGLCHGVEHGVQAQQIGQWRLAQALGALISLLVTVSDISLLNIGAAFWGLVAGFAFSWLMEKADFQPPVKVG